MLKAGDIIRIFHKEVEGFLTNERMTNEDKSEKCSLFLSFHLFFVQIFTLSPFFFFKGLFSYPPRKNEKKFKYSLAAGGLFSSSEFFFFFY